MLCILYTQDFFFLSDNDDDTDGMAHAVAATVAEGCCQCCGQGNNHCAEAEELTVCVATLKESLLELEQKCNASIDCRRTAHQNSQKLSTQSHSTSQVYVLKM